MTLPAAWSRQGDGIRPRGESLADLLERVLDKGIVVAGDIAVHIVDVELLTLKVRLLICSADTAQRMGIDWWRSDPFLTGRDERDGESRRLGGGSARRLDGGGARSLEERLEEENRELRRRLEALEARIGGGADG